MSYGIASSPAPIDHLSLRGERAAPALLLRDRVMSYAALELAVGRTAALLQAHGMKPGDRVASWVGKGAAACVLPLACPRAGLIHVPVNPLLKRAQVQHILADSGARMIVTNAARAGTLLPGDVPGGCHVLDVAHLDQAMERPGAALAPSNADGDALAAILYTSGSTGRPKGVMLSHNNLWHGAVSVAHYLKLDAGDRLLGVLPLSFDYGQNQLFSAWQAGASVAPLDYLAPADVVRAAERHAITTIAGVPPLWVQLIEAEWPNATAQRIRRITNSGGALTRRLVSRLGALFPTADIYAMYGLTEAFRATYLDPALINERPDSIGKAVPFAEVAIVDADGNEAAADAVGELVQTGPLVAQGYWNDPERTAQRFRPAPPWMREWRGTAVWSGDKARRDAEGLITFVGRDDAMIKSAGNRISPTEVEDAAEASGLVAESVAFGLADDALGQAVVLVARLNGAVEPGAEPATQLAAALRSTLPNFMQPRHIILRDAMPRNANGKLDRVRIVSEATKGLTS